ncbi:type IV secretion system protein VirB2 [Palleronia aestuarii]|uniref:Type IV secretion system protein VirB2 n=1 Tax=Palleronia aestuarii TaxID=568105 RepID=A0A2W7NBT6_9RHOB|nr:TrbC/VirB2 family protein [Palleronia aestuarii]PZX14184.1 type IV secretion system protein VirB2 [Palleronia aestuarii]
MAILTPSTGRIATVALALAVCAASPVFAQDLSPINTFFSTLGAALTGTTGKALGLVALAAVGILFLMGRMNWMFAGSVCLGLVILFSAATILSGFGAST